MSRDEDAVEAHGKVTECATRVEVAFNVADKSVHEDNPTLVRLRDVLDLQMRVEELIDALIAYRGYRP